MILLLILVLTLVVVGVGGWAADSRDVNYGLWPLDRSKPPLSPRDPSAVASMAAGPRSSADRAPAF